MVDKIINYIWLGSRPIPKSNRECMESWSKLLGFSVRKWTEDDFDIDSMPYVKMCLEKKLYAFAADYLKCWVIYNHGGIYMDCDVMVHESFEHYFDRSDNEFIVGHYDLSVLLTNGNVNKIADFILGGNKHNEIFKDVMKNFDNRETPVVLQAALSLVIFDSYIDKINLVPYEYFDLPRCGAFKKTTDINYTTHLFKGTWCIEYVKHYDDFIFTDEVLERSRIELETDI